MNEAKACCMLRVSVSLCLGDFPQLHVVTCVAWLRATVSLPVACGALSMLDDALCLRDTWLRACPTLIHTQEHEYVHTLTIIVLPCLLLLVPNAHVQRYTQWSQTEWDRIGRRCSACFVLPIGFSIGFTWFIQA